MLGIQPFSQNGDLSILVIDDFVTLTAGQRFSEGIISYTLEPLTVALAYT